MFHFFFVTLILMVGSVLSYSNFGSCCGDFRSELTCVGATNIASMSEPIAHIYNLDKNQVTQFLVGANIISWMYPRPKISLFEIQAPGKFSKFDLMRAIYNAHAEGDELRSFFIGSWPRQSEIVLRGSTVLQNLLQLIKNPPKQVVVSEEAKKIAARLNEIFMDSEYWFNGVLSNNMKTIDCVLGSMLWIYSHQRKENLNDMPVFLKNVRKKFEEDYDKKLCAEVRRRLAIEHSKLHEKYEKEIIEIREEIVTNRKNELSKAIIKEVFDETKRMKSSIPIEVPRRSGSEDTKGCVIG